VAGDRYSTGSGSDRVQRAKTTLSPLGVLYRPPTPDS
jgi:hypothetical protein